MASAGRATVVMVLNRPLPERRAFPAGGPKTL